MTRIFRSFAHVLFGTVNAGLVAVAVAEGGGDEDARAVEGGGSGALDALTDAGAVGATVASGAAWIIGAPDGSGVDGDAAVVVAIELAVPVGAGADPEDFTISIVPTAVTPTKIDAPSTISGADRRGADGTSAAWPCVHPGVVACDGGAAGATAYAGNDGPDRARWGWTPRGSTPPSGEDGGGAGGAGGATCAWVGAKRATSTRSIFTVCRHRRGIASNTAVLSAARSMPSNGASRSRTSSALAARFEALFCRR